MRRFSRRVFGLAATGLLVAPRLAWPASAKVPNSLDHVILGCNDLDAGIDYVYRKTGVRAAPGGVHPGAGTEMHYCPWARCNIWRSSRPIHCNRHRPIHVTWRV